MLVPSDSIKEFLNFYLASHPRLLISAGVHILVLEQGIVELLQLCRPYQGKKIPSFLELSLVVEQQIHLCPRRDSLFAPLWDYLESGGSDVIETRIASLSDQLARTFMLYGLYGAAFLPVWLEQRGWQQALWRQIFSVHSLVTTPLDALSVSGTCLAQVHVFGFSYLPPVYLSFFSRLKASLYQLSPCAMYWDDLCSDREKLHVERLMARKGVNAAVRAETEHYLQERHPLLANWGKLGREFLKELDAFAVDTQELYVAPGKESMLATLQNDLLLLKTSTCSQDSSIQIHSAPSKLREVEVLRDVLLNVMIEGIQPKEIVVLAPDIAAYAPYIHMVFGSLSHQIAYRIEGVEQGSMSRVAHLSFMHLLTLGSTDFSLSAIEKLLHMDPVREKWGWSSEDVHLICSWLKLAHVRAGEVSCGRLDSICLPYGT